MIGRILRGMRPFIVVFVLCSIQASGGNLSDSLFGAYYFGDGLGVNCSLELGKSGRFKYEWTGCLGTYDQAEGTYKIHDKMLVLEPKGAVESGCRIDLKNFHIIRWDQLIYLVPESDMLDFCNSINQGLEPSQYGGSFYLHRKSRGKRPKGFPKLPGNWNNFLLETPVSGKILNVTGNNAFLDAGTNKGVQTGMLFTAAGHGSKRWGELTIISVSADRSMAAVENMLDDKIKIGDCFSSRFDVECERNR